MKRRTSRIWSLVLCLAGLVCASLFSLDAAAGPITLRVLDAHLSEEPTGTLLRQLAAEYEKDYPNVKIIMESVPHAERVKKFRSSMMAGAGPDIVCCGPGENAVYNGDGYLMPLDTFVKKEGGAKFKAQFFPAAIEACTFNGKLMSYPNWGGVHAMFYNKEAFSKAGLDPNKPPKTWDEFLAAAKALTVDANKDGIPEQYGFGLYGSKHETTLRELLPWFWTNDADVFNKDMTKAVCDSAKAIQAFTFWTELATKHKVVPPGATSFDYATVSTAFAQGKVTMYQNAQWGIAKTTVDNPAMEGKFGVMPVPRNKKNAGVYIVVTLGISKQCKNPEAAWEFLKYFAGKDAAVRRAKLMRFLPTRLDASKAPEITNDPFLNEFTSYQYFARVYPTHPKMPQLLDIFGEEVQYALMQNKTPKAAMTDAARRMNAVLSAK